MQEFQRRNVMSLEPGAQDSLVLKGRAACDDWRLFSFVATGPIEVKLGWVGDASPGGEPAVISVSRAESVAVRASGWDVWATNLNPSANTGVRVGLIDQHRVCRPIYEQRFASASPAARSHVIPPFAREVRLDTEDQALMASIIQLIAVDGSTVLAGITQTRLPSWIPLGSAATVEVTSAAAYRLVWRLDIM